MRPSKSSFFKALYKRSKDQLLLLSNLVQSLLRGKQCRKCNLYWNNTKIVLKFVSKTFHKQPLADVLPNSCSYSCFRGKTPALELLFNKVVGLKTCNFIKKRFQYRFSPVKVAKFLKTSLFYGRSSVLLLIFSK